MLRFRVRDDWNWCFGLLRLAAGDASPPDYERAMVGGVTLRWMRLSRRRRCRAMMHEAMEHLHLAVTHMLDAAPWIID